jgi:hypothetical protein
VAGGAGGWRARAEELGFSVKPMRPFPTLLPDGSRIEVTDAEIVPMGDVFAYRQLNYSYDGDARRPAFNIIFEIRNRVPVCASVHLWSPESGSHVCAMDLNAIKLDDLRDNLYAFAGVFVPNPDGGLVHKIGPSAFREDRKRVERVTRRRKVTPEFLSQVAEVYNNAPVGGRIATIKTAFVVSERQAIRYKKQAEEMGMINDE